MGEAVLNTNIMELGHSPSTQTYGHGILKVRLTARSSAGDP
jgi:hypothetical protein